MRRGRAWLWSAATSAWAVACTSNEALPLPDVEGAATILVFELGGGAPRVTATTPDGLIVRSFVRGAERRVWLALLREAPEQLELIPEFPVTDTPSGSPLPTPISVLELSTVGSDWRELTPLPEEVTNFRLPLTSPTLCVQSGRCYGPDPGDLACVDCEVAAEPIAPAPPALPVLTPCPPGWILEESESATTTPDRCHVAVEACQAFALALPSAPSCAPIAACGAGRYREPLPTGPTHRYVGPDPGGVPMERVHPDLATALAASGTGDHLVLSRGDHQWVGPAPSGLYVQGACPEATTLTTPSAWPSGAVNLEGLSIAGPLNVDDGVVVVGERVLIEGPVTVQALGSLTLRGSGVVATTTVSVWGALSLVGVSWRGPGPSALGGAQLQLEDVAWVGGEMQVGLRIQDQAQVVVRRSSFRGYEVAIRQLGGALTLEQLDLQEGRIGVELVDGRLVAQGIDLRNFRAVGILVNGGNLELSDLVIESSGQRGEAGFGGLTIFSDTPRCSQAITTFTGRRLFLLDNAGVAMTLSCTLAVLEDLVVRQTRGQGVHLSTGELQGDRWEITDSADDGLTGKGTGPNPGQEFPLVAELRDLRIERSGDEAMSIGRDSDLKVERVCLRHATPHGLALRGPRVQVRIQEAKIEEFTRRGEAGAAVHLAGELGNSPVQLWLENFEIENAGYGLDLLPASDAHLLNGWFRHNEVVFRIRGEVPEVRALLRGVRFIDNAEYGLPER
ncbi:MAG: hypothetical protein IPG45_33820 [Deltaproteobacteria bacterium]|nr:hypothetical protein [Deltaproteobacteria bacterium]